MELIATHVGADFDALASSLVARRFHPRAELFFPGSRERSVRRMLGAGFVAFEELRQREIDPDDVERLILCDIRQRDRIGVLAEWLAERPGIEVLVYDHHPDTEDDVSAAGGIVDPRVGATSTLMVEELERRGEGVSATEATLLLMGIYEDTGSLSYPTTSPRDLAAVAWLLERRGDLAAVRRWALASLDGQRLEILHRMSRELEVRRLRGHRVGLVALELGAYVDELAPLVSRCLEIFELDLLFALFGEGERVTVIARGAAEGCHLGELLDGFAGGGGHATAAAGSLRGPTALEARERLLRHLEEHLAPAARAGDLMVERFHTASAEATVGEARELLNRRRVNALPVVDGEGRVLGAVTRQLVDAAVQHDLADRPVTAVMERELEWVAPEAPAEEIGERMLSQHPRFVLVGDPAEGRPRGLVTRMQVLRHLHGRLSRAGEPVERRSAERRRQRAEVAHLIRRHLPPAVVERLAAVQRVAAEHDVQVHLVGGLVRDLLLERENRDVDLVVEGDGPHFARLLAAELGGRVRVHEAFMTAVVIDPDGFRIDVATARSEFYRAPAALPEVQTSALRQDLYRRDFTINALAIRLGPDERPLLIDYFGGRRDLARGVIRVLHSLSFIDDPTRVLRAVRLELRLDFEISPETVRLVETALAEGVFDRLSGSRLRDELVLLLDDAERVERALERLDELGLIAVLHADLELDEAVRGRVRHAVAAWDWFELEGLREPPVRLWRLVLLALVFDLPRRERLRLADRLHLAGEERRALGDAVRRVVRARDRLGDPGLAPHRAAAVVRALGGEEALLLMALGDEASRDWVRRALAELLPLELSIRGGDLVEQGVEPGPRIGRALARTRDARLDGLIDRDEELVFALRAAAEEPSGKGAEESGVDGPVAAATESSAEEAAG